MRFLALASLAVVGATAACSAPKSTSDERATTGPTRDLSLVGLATDSAPVSAIEVGQAAAKPAVRAAVARVHRHVEAPPVAEPTQEAPAALAALSAEAAPTLQVTTAAAGGILEVPTTLAQAPAVPEMFPAGGIRAEVDPVYQGRFGGGITGGGGPRIMIRGGRGGIDDDCDLDRPGHHGAAVNRLGPATAGGVLRAPIARVGRGRGIR